MLWKYANIRRCELWFRPSISDRISPVLVVWGSLTSYFVPLHLLRWVVLASGDWRLHSLSCWTPTNYLWTWSLLGLAVGMLYFVPFKILQTEYFTYNFVWRCVLRGAVGGALQDMLQCSERFCRECFCVAFGILHLADCSEYLATDGWLRFLSFTEAIAKRSSSNPSVKVLKPLSQTIPLGDLVILSDLVICRIVLLFQCWRGRALQPTGETHRCLLSSSLSSRHWPRAIQILSEAWPTP